MSDADLTKIPAGPLLIDTEFQSLFPPLTPQELDILTDSVLTEGCREPLMCWGDILIDGHNRYKICLDHGLGFDTKQLDIKRARIDCGGVTDRETVMLWIIRNQLGRRNLTAADRASIASKYLDEAEQEEPHQRGTSVSAGTETPHENVPEQDEVKPLQRGVRSSAQLRTTKSGGDRIKKAAEAVGISKGSLVKYRTIEKAVKDGRADKSILDDLKSGKKSLTKAYEEAKWMPNSKPEEVQQPKPQPKEYNYMTTYHLIGVPLVAEDLPKGHMWLVFDAEELRKRIAPLKGKYALELSADDELQF